MPRWRSRWDQWLLYVMLGLYGLGSLVNQTPAMTLAPLAVSLPIYALFIAGPALLVVGTLTNRLRTYIVGTAMTFVALLGLGVTVAVIAASPGIFLTLALAAVLVMRLRRLSRNRHSLLAADGD